MNGSWRNLKCQAYFSWKIQKFETQWISFFLNMLNFTTKKFDKITLLYFLFSIFSDEIATKSKCVTFRSLRIRRTWSFCENENEFSWMHRHPSPLSLSSIRRYRDRTTRNSPTNYHTGFSLSRPPPPRNNKDGRVHFRPEKRAFFADRVPQGSSYWTGYRLLGWDDDPLELRSGFLNMAMRNYDIYGAGFSDAIVELSLLRFDRSCSLFFFFLKEEIVEEIPGGYDKYL